MAEASQSGFREATEVPTGRLGVWWFVASELVIFGGLIVTYLLFRWKHPEWAAEAHHTLNAAGALNTMVLLSSSLTVVLAHEAAGRGEHARAARLLGLT
ncbi:MAG: cytochrome oxidase subunit III, partial [Myxococcota bacterium]